MPKPTWRWVRPAESPSGYHFGGMGDLAASASIPCSANQGNRSRFIAILNKAEQLQEALLQAQADKEAWRNERRRLRRVAFALQQQQLDWASGDSCPFCGNPGADRPTPHKRDCPYVLADEALGTPTDPSRHQGPLLENEVDKASDSG